MKRVAIVGGGITGLSAAFYLEKARRNGTPLEYVLFESSARLGGVVRTEYLDGCAVEAGADSFLTAKLWAADLARDAGIGDQLLPSNDQQRKTYIFDRDRLTPLPDGMQMMVPTKTWPVVISPLLSPATKLRMLREFISPPAPLPADQDESVASFVNRHFGDEAVNKLAAPLLAGIYGGNAEGLSARAALPNLVALESKHGSLVRGTLRAMAECEGAPRAALFTSFRRGMQQLVDAVSAKIEPTSIRLNAAVTSIAETASGWRVRTASSGEDFSDVVFALPAYLAPTLLGFDPPLASALASIHYSDSITVALAYDKSRAPRLPAGFGFLVPRSEGRAIIACTFVHNKFSNRVPDDRLLLRAFLTEGLGRSDAELIATVEKDLRYSLGRFSAPQFTRVYRWPRAMPQYEVGHLDRIVKIEGLLSKHAGLQLVGSAYRGLGVPDCVREGKRAAERILTN